MAETEEDTTPERFGATSMRLNSVIVRIWAKLFRAGSVWDFFDLVGDSLEEYADLLDRH